MFLSAERICLNFDAGFTFFRIQRIFTQKTLGRRFQTLFGQTANQSGHKNGQNRSGK